MLTFITGLVIDGYWSVFSTLLGFLPTVVVLLMLISFFENSAFTLGFACTTLAISQCPRCPRTARFLTFIPCGAKIPVLMFLTTAVLGWSVFGVIFLYLFSIFVGLILGGFSVIKCPKLKKITPKNFFKNLIRNTLEFLQRISVGLIIAVTALYTLQYFKLLLPITGIFAPLFAPIGLNSAPVVAALLFGLVAKEMIVGAVLTFGVATLGLTTASALSFLIFVLFYTPCIPALSAIRAKLGVRAMWGTAAFNFAFAYLAAMLVYLVAVAISLC